MALRKRGRPARREEPCPDVAELMRLLNAAGATPDEELLAAHLEQCTGCRRRLEALAGDTPAPGAIQVTPQFGVPAEGPLRRVMESLKAEAAVRWKAAAEPAPVEELTLHFLAPPDRPGYLGRLGWYEVAEVIGRGGMGIVLKALDPALQRFVAIKVLSPHLATSAAARQRFAREGRAAATVSHEHLVAIHGVDEAGGIPYLVMEYVAGTSLQERLDRAGALPLEEVLRIGMQAASGLAAAHAQGLVHRDVKPANILLERGTDRVKITDFGLARAADDASVTQSGFLAGTPQYMAPEQARGEALDHRADLFSLGSVLYALCTGQPPFRGRTTMAVLRRLCEEAPPPVREVNPAVPPWLADVIAVLHAKEPDERFQSAAEVSDLLCGYLAYVQQPALVLRPAGPGRRRVRRATAGGRRRSWWTPVLVALAAGLLSVGLTAGGAWLLATWSRPAPSTPALARLRVRPRAELSAFDGPVMAVAYAPGSEVLAAAADDRALYLLDAASCRPLARLDRHPYRVWSVAFSPDGKAFASAAGHGLGFPGPGELKVWDATTRTPRTLAGHRGQVYSVAFSPDSRTLVSGGADQTARLWDVASGRQRLVLRGHTAAVRSVAFAPDGTAVATASFDGTVRLWDAGTGHLRNVFRSPGCFCNCVAFSPDGATVASADNPVPPPGKENDPSAWEPGVVSVWDVATGRRSVLYGHRGRALCVAFSPDGRSLVSGGGSNGTFGEVIFWAPATGQQRLTLHGHQRAVESVAFSPDGRALASGGGTAGEPGEVKLWDVNPPPAADVPPLADPGGRPAPPRAFPPAGLDQGQLPTGGSTGLPPAPRPVMEAHVEVSPAAPAPPQGGPAVQSGTAP